MIINKAYRRLATLLCGAVLAAGLGVGVSTPAQAGMGNTASTYGLLPMDVASAQGLSLFNAQASALYYNPAYLTRDPRGELTLGMMHAAQELRAASQGSPSGGGSPVTREGDVLSDAPSQQVLIAMKTDLTDLTKFNHPLYFAFIAGVEKYGEEMLAFNSQTSTEGQFFQYGRQPLFLNLGGGVELFNGITGGASAHVSLRSDATLVASADLAGNTQYERLDVTARPVIRPVVSVNFEWGKVFCGNNDRCGFLGDLETALAFRGHTEARTSVESNITIPGTVVDPGITLLIDTLDSYQPDIYSAGLLYHLSDRFRLALAVEQQNWQDLEDKLDRDTIKDQANVALKDIVVPRIGAEWTVNDSLILTAGAAWQESPLESLQTPDVNYLDSDKTIVGVGASWIVRNPPVLAFPLRLDFGYQFQRLEKREFELTTTRPGVTNPYETVSADGEANIFSGSITVKF
ncbi:outer membrane protein transport protein [Alcanivorax sp.]|jgi:long-subunit fatty acid transport protein|uniref:OmpP1/FadL family transporter n=1 Tax=Alcanivorax sp. TaxID=1872427 RepID=UPI0025C5B87C|nr:outer membrane protein transport protein [Alcanivorax sp.]